MKGVLLVLLIVSFTGVKKVQISPVLWTNDQIKVSKISVEAVNQTDASVDILWRIYNDTDSIVDYGIIQLSAIDMGVNGGAVPDTDFMNYQVNPDSFALPYVCGKKGFTISN